MTVTTYTLAPQGPTDLLGRRVAARLSEGTQQLPHAVSERLRAARVRAVANRKLEVASPLRGYALAGAGRLVDEGLSLWGRLASAVPMVVLAAGLVTIHVIQNDLRASEVAEVDAALLIDDLPPEAYADAGFVRFLKSSE
jgi:hypothetical protein